jgi:hypothetical protein
MTSNNFKSAPWGAVLSSLQDHFSLKNSEIKQKKPPREQLVRDVPKVGDLGPEAIKFHCAQSLTPGIDCTIK